MMKRFKQICGFKKRPACDGQYAPPGSGAVPGGLPAGKELPAQTKPIFWNGGNPPQSPSCNQNTMGTAKYLGLRGAGIPACCLARCRLEACAASGDSK
jgi:hypothetical protein